MSAAQMRFERASFNGRIPKNDGRLWTYHGACLRTAEMGGLYPPNWVTAGHGGGGASLEEHLPPGPMRSVHLSVQLSSRTDLISSVRGGGGTAASERDSSCEPAQQNCRTNHVRSRQSLRDSSCEPVLLCWFAGRITFTYQFCCAEQQNW